MTMEVELFLPTLENSTSLTGLWVRESNDDKNHMKCSSAIGGMVAKVTKVKPLRVILNNRYGLRNLIKLRNLVK